MSGPSRGAAARARTSGRPTSLRVRLTAAFAVVIIVTIAVAAVLLVWRVRASLQSGLDSSLSQRVQDVAAEVRSGQLSTLATTGAQSAVLVQVINADGHVVASSANINGEPALFRYRAGGQSPTVQTVADIPGADPGSYRVASATVSTPTGTVSLYAAGSMSEVSASVRQVGVAALVGAPFLVALLSAIIWILVGRALRPVEAMRQTVSAMRGHQPHDRLANASAPVELARLGGTFDDLLDRIDRGVAQQRQFLADAAHELRNPVASILTRLETHEQHPTLSGVDRARLHADAARLASIVDALLSLARLDADVALRADPVDVDDIVFDQVRTVVGKRVDVTHVSAAQVIGDRAALERVVRNLLDNASRHAAAQVKLELCDDGQAVVLTVADDGPGIPATERDRVFARFTRLDDARARDEGGAGLGLAIVHDIVDRHHGSVHIEDNQPGTRVVVRLPSSRNSGVATGCDYRQELT